MTVARTWLWLTILLTVGALTCAITLAPAAGAPATQALSWLLFTGSSVHVASTGWLFTVPEVRAFVRQHRVRCLWLPAGLVMLGAAAAAAIGPDEFRWLLVPYFGWQFWHYQKQNIGVTALAASAQRKAPLRPAERRPLLLAGASSVAAIAARPGLLGLQVTPVAHALFPFAATAYVLAVATGLAAIARRPRADRTPGFCATYLVSLLFALPAFCFASPYAAVGGMTVAHGLQYLVLVSLAVGSRPEAAAAGGSGRSRLVRLAVLGNIALIGGAALNRASHLHDAGPGGRALFGAYLGVVMAHFVIDAGIWRMRDPLARRFVATQLPYLVPAASAVLAAPAAPAPPASRLPMDRQPI
jgi:hypothetical protein